MEGFIARLGCTKVASHRRRAGKRKHGRITRLVVVSKPVRFGKVASLSLSLISVPSLIRFCNSSECNSKVVFPCIRELVKV